MSFAAPWWLLLLPLLPVIGWFLRRPGDSDSGAITYPRVLALPPTQTPRQRVAVGLPWMTIIALALLILAMARPQRLEAVGTRTSEGIDIVLALDISGSMRATDLGSRNRFEVARDVMRDFIARSSGDRLALVIFAGQAFTQCPLTTDHTMVSRLLEKVEMGMVDDGTAIGMAIATAAARLEQSEAESRIIILLTDGVNNTGAIDPTTAAKLAGALGIRIYTVGVGNPGGSRIPADDPMFGRGHAREPEGRFHLMEFDEEELRRIAALSGGEYFSAADPDALEQIYEHIRTLEKSDVEMTEYRRYEELAGALILPAIALIALQVLLSCTWLRKIP